MTQQELDDFVPKLPPLELAICITTCNDAGAVNAANALSKHVSRQEIELDSLRAELVRVTAELAELERVHAKCPVDAFGPDNKLSAAGKAALAEQRKFREIYGV